MDVRDDGPVDIGGWTPTNFGGRSYGTVTLADALAHSINTITAGLAQEVGVTTVVDAAHRCGITSELEPNASLALGTSEVTPLELTTAYAAFASGGYRVYPYFVTEVDDPAGHILYKREAPKPERVIASHIDRDLTAMLYGVVTQGTGRSAAVAGHEAAGKTGTTQDYHDAWFVGFTADYVTGVWVGNDDSSPMKTVTGGSLPAAIWHDTMTAAERSLPATPLDKSVLAAPVDDTGTTFTAGGEDDSNAGTDDEAGRPSGGPAPQQSQSFWNWIFGRNNPPPPPPPPEQQAPPPDPQASTPPQQQQQQQQQQNGDDPDDGGH
jgi:penicillin-binding protein 1A